jgi:chromosome segregation ATPase
VTYQKLNRELDDAEDELAAAVEALKRIKRYVESTTQALGELSTEADVDALNLIDAALAKIGGGK